MWDRRSRRRRRPFRVPLRDRPAGVIPSRLVLAVDTADAAQVGSAVFTALAALAALATVVRAERDRRDRALPDLHVEVVQDLGAGQVRAYVVNYGGPAREVRIYGVLGAIGFGGPIGPTTYWRPGESRTLLLGAPVNSEVEISYVLVEGRDGASATCSCRRLAELSTAGR